MASANKEYLTVHDVIYVKMAQDPAAAEMAKLQKPRGSLIRTTGEAWTDEHGGLWEEIDSGTARWVLLDCPGRTRGPLLIPSHEGVAVLIRGCGTLAHVDEFVICPGSWTVSRLIAEVALRCKFDRRDAVLTRFCPYSGDSEKPGDPSLHMDTLFTRRKDILNPCTSLAVCNIGRCLYLSSLGLCADGPNPRTRSDPAMNESEPLERGLVAPPQPKQTADLATFIVAHPVVVLRASPSTEAKMLGKILDGDQVCGIPHKCDNDPWLLLGRDECHRLHLFVDVAWVLIHGACLGLGALLKKVPGTTWLGPPREKNEQDRQPPPRKTSGRNGDAESEEAMKAEAVRREEEAWRQEEETAAAVESARAIAAEKLHLVESKMKQMEIETARKYEEKVAQKVAREEKARKAEEEKAEQAARKLLEVEEKLKRLEKENLEMATKKATNEKDSQEAKKVSASGIALPEGMPAEWGVEAVVQWLHSIELGSLEAQFRADSVDGDMLMQLSIEELIKELGVRKLHAVKIKRKLEALMK